MVCLYFLKDFIQFILLVNDLNLLVNDPKLLVGKPNLLDDDLEWKLFCIENVKLII